MPFDAGIGLLLGVLLSTLTNINHPLCLAIGLTAGLLPDVDFIIYYVRHRALPSTKHRDTFHVPLIFIPVVGIIGYAFNPYIGLVMALGALSHFVHDSFGIGFGLKWLAPFKENSYLFIYQANVGTNKEMPKKLIYSWSDTERDEAIKKYRNPNWVKLIYLRPHPFGMFEYVVLVIGILAASR